MTGERISFFVRAQAWWAGRAPRERAFAALFAATIAVMMMINAADALSAARGAAEESAAALAREKSRHAMENDAAYAIATERLARAARRASFGGETVHIARVRAQGEVEQLAIAAGLQDVEVTLIGRDRPASGPSTVEEIDVALSADGDEAGLARFLQALGSSEYSLVPVEVSVRRSQSVRLEMQIRAFTLQPERGT